MGLFLQTCSLASMACLTHTSCVRGTGTYICCGRGRSTDTAGPADTHDSCEGSDIDVTPAEKTQDTARHLSTSATSHVASGQIRIEEVVELCHT